MRHGDEQPRAGDFTPQERTELRGMLEQKRNFAGFSRVIITFSKWFVALGAGAILFNQTARDFVSMVKGLFK